MIIEREIKKVKISDLVYDETNPNKMNKQQMQGLEESMKRFGYLTPIIIDQSNNKIADGEHRIDVYKQFGLSEIPAFRVEFKDDAERRLLRQTMNKLRGEHDRDLDLNEIRLLYETDNLDNLSKLIAKDKEAIELLLANKFDDLAFLRPEIEDEGAAIEIDPNAPTITQKGQVQQLGQHKLYCDDNLTILKQIPDDYFDLTVTSPPYDNLLDYLGYDFDMSKLVPELYRVTKQGGVIVWVVGDIVDPHTHGESLSSFRHAIAFQEAGFAMHDTMIYKKPGFVFPEAVRYHQCFEYMFVLSKGKDGPRTFNPIKDRIVQTPGESVQVTQREKDGRIKRDWHSGRKYGEIGMRTNIWEYAGSFMAGTTDKEAYNHPALFPERLAEDHIKSWSNEGDQILDPFLGSGTTLKASEKLDRQCTGIEISPHYCDIVVARWKKLDAMLQKVS